MKAAITLDTTVQLSEQREAKWRIELLGGMRLLREEQEMPHFKTRRPWIFYRSGCGNSGYTVQVN